MSEAVAVSEMSLRTSIAEEIQVLLVRRRMSTAQLARSIGMKQPYMSRRMTGEVAWDVDDLQRIAAVLNVDVVDLLPARREGRAVTTNERRSASERDLTGFKPRRPDRPINARPKGRPINTATGHAISRPARVGAALARL